MSASPPAETQARRTLLETIQEYSLPLIIGVLTALVLANVLGEHDYHELIDVRLFSFTLFGREMTVTPHWLVNDIFMVFFFGIAAKEIADAMLPGGALNPPSKAINPLFGTAGGVLGPVAVYFALTFLLVPAGPEQSSILKGWGIPTATDIALAWLAARIVFGSVHPAVNFLLLLAIADDAIGLIIIAIFYPNPSYPTEPIWLGFTLLGMLVAFGLRAKGVRNWVPYVVLGGLLSWIGLLRAGLHPALALVPIIPFLPGPAPSADLSAPATAHSNPLHEFEHRFKLPVDFGLFFFGLTNAGVQVFGKEAPAPEAGAELVPTAAVSPSIVTLIVLLALLIGKPLGIASMAWLANRLGFAYPTGMAFRHTVAAGVVAAIGLTVALFVAGQAFPAESPWQGAAKLGALLSAIAIPISIVVGRALRAKELDKG